MEVSVEDTSQLLPPRLMDLGRSLLRGFSAGLGLEPPTVHAAKERWFSELSVNWGTFRLDQGPSWPSDITDDHTPFELSLAMVDGQAEARLLAEVGPDSHFRLGLRGEDWLEQSWNNGRAFNEVIRREEGVDLGSLDAVIDLFRPAKHPARFAMWHAVGFRSGEVPRFKVYLNPRAAGRPPREIVDAALQRLDLRWVLDVLPPSAEAIEYFALDLSSNTSARVKIYVAHPSATAEAVERAGEAADDYTPGRVSGFTRKFTGFGGPYDARPVLTCFAGVKASQRVSTTVHVPVRSYAQSDAEVRDRLMRVLPPASASLYRAALSAFPTPPPSLQNGAGLHTYVSQSLVEGRDRFTVYLAPRAYTSPPREVEP